MLEPQPFLNPRPVARLPRMSKRPYEDVKDVYTGRVSRRRAVAREMENLGMGSPLGSPMPEDIGPPYHSQLRPGIEALDVSAPATGMSLSHFESSPTVGAASSIDAAMQDETASGQDAAPDPQDAAHDPNRDPASGQGAAPPPDRKPLVLNTFSSCQDAPAHRDQDTASSQVAPGQEADMQDAPPQEADAQAAAPQNKQVMDKKGFWWRLDNAWNVWMWWDTDMDNWMWKDDDGWWYPNWQPAWRRRRSDGERNWSARENWHESSSWGSMEE